MKKFGFTLAEVLITLAIIGFIASVTLPSLTTSTGDRQAAVALKKAINTLTNAAQLSQAIDGTDFGSMTRTTEFRQSLIKRANVDQTLAEIDTNGAAETNKLDIQNGKNRALFFRDGTALIFPDEATITNAARTVQSDNYVKGFGAIVDINGRRGPNQVSFCGEGTGNHDITTCDSRRTIRDQFPIRIRGNIVVPNSAASRWVLAQ